MNYSKNANKPLAIIACNEIDSITFARTEDNPKNTKLTKLLDFLDFIKKFNVGIVFTSNSGPATQTAEGGKLYDEAFLRRINRSFEIKDLSANSLENLCHFYHTKPLTDLILNYYRRTYGTIPGDKNNITFWTIHCTKQNILKNIPQSLKAAEFTAADVQIFFEYAHQHKKQNQRSTQPLPLKDIPTLWPLELYLEKNKLGWVKYLVPIRSNAPHVAALTTLLICVSIFYKVAQKSPLLQKALQKQLTESRVQTLGAVGGIAFIIYYVTYFITQVKNIPNHYEITQKIIQLIENNVGHVAHYFLQKPHLLAAIQKMQQNSPSRNFDDLKNAINNA